ncbi:hypothetical protein SPAR2_1951 [Streptococcus pneumoniae GA02270]|nr:hypothetical protein SPAR2_1951 [Streptococcus pneumoniae GA02270]
MKPADTKKFIKDLKKEIYKLDLQIDLAKSGMDIAKKSRGIKLIIKAIN